MKTEKQIASAAADFARRWKGRGYEKGDSQPFWMDLLANVFGVENVTEFIRYEEQVKVDATNFIDGHISSTRVLIEQKSIDKDLRAPITQSDGQRLTPFQQGKRYSAELPYSQRPRWIVTCNFREFLVYDMEQPNGEPESILLENLGKEYYRLQFLVDVKSEHLRKEMEVSMQAGEIVGKIYEALLAQYNDNSPEALRWLNILCVRIVFCLYAEDAGVFLHDQFHDYLARYEADDLRNALMRLFDVLNTPLEKRSKYLQQELAAFPYTNGGLFEEEIEIPQFTEELKQTMLQHASLDFDWSEISPTIFGAVFESTLNPETRRSGGMHYTSIENIHKVIDPLFLNDLRRELDDILEETIERQRQKKLDAYQKKLASLTFLDPACGSGNFLTETYLSLRRLENEAISARYHGQAFLGFEEVNPIKVSIQQFYGIEINDFAVTVATTALWISEAQMLRETERIIRHDIDFLPLKSYANIKEANALRLSWDEWEIDEKNPTIIAKNAYIYSAPQDEEPLTASEPVLTYGDVDIIANQATTYNRPRVPELRRVKFDYIMGNPPFVGKKEQSREQKEDLMRLFDKKAKGIGNVDYVAGWYQKALRTIRGEQTKAAFVSTNSITQGEQVPILWRELYKSGIDIIFAHRTFRWDSEASDKAHVHCVIIGFTNGKSDVKKTIYDGEIIREVKEINPYLVEGAPIFIDKREKPVCNVPQIMYGSMPIDDGHLILSREDVNALLKESPDNARFIRKYAGGDEIIKNKERWCLWLVGISPREMRQSPLIMERVHRTMAFRQGSNRPQTLKLAETPYLFGEIRQPETNMLVIPKVSSERRRYIPVAFVSPGTIINGSALIVPDATAYEFGVIISNVHMAWMRAICGRMKSDYQYSGSNVYNNFPWPVPTEEQKQRIAQTAQAILDARALYPDSSLADLYDEAAMPPALRKAHQDNDRAVMQAYGFPIKKELQESYYVAELFKLYQELTKQYAPQGIENNCTYLRQ